MILRIKLDEPFTLVDSGGRSIVFTLRRVLSSQRRAEVEIEFEQPIVADAACDVDGDDE